jgi:hypothetical protein
MFAVFIGSIIPANLHVAQLLNIGLDLKIISPTLFAMMVLMALATTVATSPVVQWLCPAGKQDEDAALSPAPSPD